MSALASNAGADCNLLVSPLKVNVGPIDPEVEDELELLELPELDGRNRLHGTAICLPFKRAFLSIELQEETILQLQFCTFLYHKLDT